VNIRTWSKAAAVLLLAAGCGGSKQMAGKVAPAPSGVPLDTSALRIFAPAQDTVLTPLLIDWPPRNASVDTVAPTQEPDLPAAPGTIYRIQLFTSKNMAEATAVRDEAAGEFEAEVRVDYETPYYKVRVGRFATAEDAEPTLKRARQLGYRGAWAVRVRAAGVRD
jgi:hypothetical protein